MTRCDLCSRPAVVEVDVQRRLYRGGTQTQTWPLCGPHRALLDERLAKLNLHWQVVAERETGGERP